MKPVGITQQAYSGAPSCVSITIIAAVLEARLTTVFTPFSLSSPYYFIYPSERYTGGIQLRPPLSLQRSSSTPELILLCEIATLSKAECTIMCGASSA